ncbi:MAG: hypothetical protein M3033_10225 [Acidobacteriota bacterium]|nr:hypothetical protein [Acidobacteriota bacterium]
MESEKYPYQKEWAEYRRRRNITFLVFLSPLLFVAISALILNLFGLKFIDNFVADLIIFATWAVCYGIALHRFHTWKCPRCRNQYFTYSFLITSPIFLDNCRSCDLWKYEGSSFINY